MWPHRYTLNKLHIDVAFYFCPWGKILGKEKKIILRDVLLTEGRGCGGEGGAIVERLSPYSALLLPSTVVRNF